MVMVTAFGRQEILKTVQDAGIDDVLIKPVNPSALFDAALRSIRGEALPPVQDADTFSKYQEALAQILGARILLVEDNVINQQVAWEILTDAGFAVEIAVDGRSALEKISAAPQSWDLVLMDTHRPAADVSITGHTDTVGKAELNEAIALKRAQAISDLLKQNGMQPFALTVGSHGKRNLLVPTPDETPEPRNRRVEVSVR
jgi:two-component system sensor histidine kinase/response regulator